MIVAVVLISPGSSLRNILERFEVGDLIRIKDHCKSGGEVGIIIKCYYGQEFELLMTSGRKIRAMGMNIEVANAP
jgi:hypothetical protein